MKYNLPVAAALLLLANSCSTGPRSASTGEKLEDFAAPSLPGDDLETIAIMGINDIHGALAPQDARTREKNEAEGTPYRRGGVAYLASYARVLREEFGDRFLLLDGGDEFQGSIESNAEEGAPMVQAYNELGVTAAAIGNHEFDFGPVGPEGTPGDPIGALKARMNEARFPFVSSNILIKGTGRRPDFPRSPSRLLVRAGRTDVGIIGLSTLDTPVTTRPEFVKELEFTDLKEATVREAKALRKEGAEIVVVAAHVGLKCEAGRSGPAARFRKASDPQGKCGDKDEMVRLLRSLPPGTVDAAVSGHSHQVVHHWVAGVPVVQGGTRASFFNVIYLTYDHKARKLAGGRTRIEGPISVCPEVFARQGDCNGDRPAPPEGRGPLRAPEFHGRSIAPDARMEAVLEPVFERSETLKKKVVGEAARPVEHNRFAESAMGNLLSDAIRDYLKADFGLINSGGIRAGFEAGPITYEALFRVLPFDNSVSLITLSGRELKDLLRVAQNGARGFFPTSGLKLRVIELGQEAPSEDLNKNGRIDSWELKRLIEARQFDGSAIQDSKTYRLATVDFLVLGGDDMGWAMSRIPSAKIQQTAGPAVRDLVVDYLGKQSPINRADTPLIRPDLPRLVLEKPPAERTKRRRRR